MPSSRVIKNVSLKENFLELSFFVIRTQGKICTLEHVCSFLRFLHGLLYSIHVKLYNKMTYMRQGIHFIIVGKNMTCIGKCR